MGDVDAFAAFAGRALRQRKPAKPSHHPRAVTAAVPETGVLPMAAAPAGSVVDGAGSGLPRSCSIRASWVPVLDQGTLGDCSAYASLTALNTLFPEWSASGFTPSHMYQYTNARLLGGDTNLPGDNGASISDACLALLSGHVCPDAALTTSGGTVGAPVPLAAFAAARAATTATAGSAWPAEVSVVNIANGDINAMKAAVAGGCPVVFGAILFHSFADAQATGIVPMPAMLDGVIGGHALTILGFDDDTCMFEVQNSWGTNWGAGGFLYFPYNYMANGAWVWDIHALIRGTTLPATLALA